jgi:hypothetical protein
MIQILLVDLASLEISNYSVIDLNWLEMPILVYLPSDSM